jgi:hypothetical protein
MTIDDAILPADFAARQRACFPFADKPFWIAIRRFACTICFRFCRIVQFAFIIVYTILRCLLDAHWRSCLYT